MGGSGRSVFGSLDNNYKVIFVEFPDSFLILIISFPNIISEQRTEDTRENGGRAKAEPNKKHKRKE